MENVDFGDDDVELKDIEGAFIDRLGRLRRTLASASPLPGETVKTAAVRAENKEQEKRDGVRAHARRHGVSGFFCLNIA